MRMTRLAVTAFTLLAGLTPALAHTDWEVAKTFKIGGQGAWDLPAGHQETAFLTHICLQICKRTSSTSSFHTMV